MVFLRAVGFSFVACLPLLVVAGPAAAQVTVASQAGGPADQATGDQLGEVIVTAQRRAEDLQRTPVAVTAVSGDELNREEIRSASDLQGVAPGAIFISDSQVAVRGITNNFIQGGIAYDNSVSTFVDGIVDPHSIPGLLYDVNRVELLRGPQGTLYGRNTTAGDLNIYNNRPTNQFDAEVGLEGGDYSRISTEGMVNVPLSDTVAVRAAFLTLRHGPYQSDGFDTQDAQAGRIRLSFQPNDRLSFLVGFDYEHDADVAAAAAFYPPGTPNAAGAFRPWSGLPVCPGGAYVPFQNCVGNDPRTNNVLHGVIGQADLDLGFGTLSYLGGDRVNTTDSATYEGTGTPYTINHVSDNWQSHEVRLSNPDASPIKWTLGGYYFDESFDMLFEQNPPTGSPVAEWQVLPSSPGNSKSSAAFGQATVPIIPQLRLTGGIRYTHDTKDATQSQYDVPTLNSPPPAGTTIYNLTYDRSKTTYKVGLEGDVTPTVLAYVNYSTGYKSGGFYNAFGTNTFLPETIQAYQGGFKSRFLDNRLQLNMDGFYYNYDDFQVQTLGFGQFNPPPAPPGLGLLTLNAQKARFDGAEADVVFLLTPNDRFHANISWLQTDLVNFTIPPSPFGASDLDGFSAPYSPPESGRIDYRHTFNLGSYGKIDAQVQDDLSEGYWVQIQRLPGSYQRSYQRTGVDITYYSADGRWLLDFWGRNLENTATIQSFLFGIGPSPASAIVSGEPRIFGVRFSTHFH